MSYPSEDGSAQSLLLSEMLSDLSPPGDISQSPHVECLPHASLSTSVPCPPGLPASLAHALDLRSSSSFLSPYLWPWSHISLCVHLLYPGCFASRNLLLPPHHRLEEVDGVGTPNPHMLNELSNSVVSQCHFIFLYTVMQTFSSLNI